METYIIILIVVSVLLMISSIVYFMYNKSKDLKDHKVIQKIKTSKLWKIRDSGEEGGIKVMDTIVELEIIDDKKISVYGFGRDVNGKIIEFPDRAKQIIDYIILGDKIKISDVYLYLENDTLIMSEGDKKNSLDPTN